MTWEIHQKRRASTTVMLEQAEEVKTGFSAGFWGLLCNTGLSVPEQNFRFLVCVFPASRLLVETSCASSLPAHPEPQPPAGEVKTH